MSPKLAELLQQAEALSAGDQLKLIAHLAQNLSAASQTLTAVAKETQTGETLLELMERLTADMTDEEISQLPSDGAEQHDHYLYGAPKQYE